MQRKFQVLDLFSGIGGFSLGLERTGGFKTVAFGEVDEFCRQVLNHHWPDVPVYGDVCRLTAERLAKDGIYPDVLAGGFPCQDISLAGKGVGLSGERSGLWYEFHRLIDEIRPQWAIIENVSALRSRGLDAVLGGLAEIGYVTEWHCIPASAVGAPHQRDRIWIVCYPNGCHADRKGEPIIANAHFEKRTPSKTVEEWQRGLDELVAGDVAQSFDSYADALRILDEIPSRVDRLRALGNALVPEIPQIIGQAILTACQR